MTREVQHVLHLAGDDTADYTTTWQYIDNQNEVVMTDPRGIETTVFKDSLDRVIKSVVDSGGLDLETDYTYDANGNLATVRDPQNGDVDEAYTYDGLGRLIRVQYAAAPGDTGPVQETYTYDDANNRMIETDRNGIVFTTTYDGLHRELSETADETLSGAGVVTLMKYSYDDPHNSVTTTDANGNSSTVEYDGLGRLIKSTDALGETVEDTYDGVNKISEVDIYGTTTTYEYDDLNRLVLQEQGPDGQGLDFAQIRAI